MPTKMVSRLKKELTFNLCIHLCKSLITLTLLVNSTCSFSEPQPRIISLAPHLTEMIFSAGAGDLLVGVVSYSDYPEQAKSIANVGQYNSINIEAILKQKPTLIIAWQSGDTTKEINKLEQLGIEIWRTEVNKLSDIPKQIKQIGQRTNRSEIANREANKLTVILDKLSAQPTRQNPKTVFYQVWKKPLYTVGKNQFISQAIKLCGAKNIFEHINQPAPEVSIESVIKHNPDMILLGGRQELQTQWRQDWQKYSSISAVKNKRIINVENSVYQRPTARFIKAIPALCQNIYSK